MGDRVCGGKPTRSCCPAQPLLAPLTRQAAPLAVAPPPLQEEEGVGPLGDPQRVGQQHLLGGQPHDEGGAAAAAAPPGPAPHFGLGPQSQVGHGGCLRRGRSRAALACGALWRSGWRTAAPDSGLAWPGFASAPPPPGQSASSLGGLAEPPCQSCSLRALLGRVGGGAE